MKVFKYLYTSIPIQISKEQFIITKSELNTYNLLSLLYFRKTQLLFPLKSSYPIIETQLFFISNIFVILNF